MGFRLLMGMDRVQGRGRVCWVCPHVCLPRCLSYSRCGGSHSAASASALPPAPVPRTLDRCPSLPASRTAVPLSRYVLQVGQSYSMKTSAIRMLAAALGDMCAAGEEG